MSVVNNPIFVSKPGTPQPNFPLYSREDIVRSIRPEEWDWGKPKVETLSKPLLSNASTLNFPGLIGFVYHCWANELSMELSPTLFHDRLVSELCSFVSERSETFRSLFTESSEKQTLETTTWDETELNIPSLIGFLKEKIPSRDLLNSVLNVSFSTDTPEAILSRQMALCQMAIPYYDYITSKCGIPSIRFSGTLADWLSLLGTIQVIKRLTVPLLSSKEKEHWSNYLDGFESIVDTIIGIVKGDTCSPKSFQFVHTILRHEENPTCGSGHTQNVVSGWILRLYFNFFNTSRDRVEIELRDFPSDIHFVPYQNKESGRMFFKAIGILDAMKDSSGTMVAKYVQIKEEIMDVEYFALLSHKEIVPIVHRNVRCDQCNIFPIVGIRYKCKDCEDFDLCETCFPSAAHGHLFNRIEKPIPY